MESISNAADCMRSDLLAWVHYGFQDPSSVYYCFPYPQYASSERGFKAVNPEAFPNRGAFVALLNRTSAAELQRQCGEIVVVRINRDEPDENPEYAGPLDPRANKFCARLPQGSSVNPELTITKLSAHGLSSRLVTVIELGSAFDISKPTKRSLGLSSPSSTESIDTSLVVIRNGDRLHGPFEYALGENGHIVLRGSSDYDFRVYSSIDASSMDEVIVHDMNGYSVAEFRLKSQLDDAIGSGRYRGQFDWIPLDKLQAILERAMKQSAEFTDISKNAFRRFKREINAIEDTLADALRHAYGMTFVKSCTTRPRRTPDEDTHVFLTEQQAEPLVRDAVAYTRIGDYIYFTTAQQVMETEGYVIDPIGMRILCANMPNTRFVIASRSHGSWSSSVWARRR